MLGYGPEQGKENSKSYGFASNKHHLIGELSKRSQYFLTDKHTDRQKDKMHREET